MIKYLLFLISLTFFTSFQAAYASFPSTDVRFYTPFEEKLEATETTQGTCNKHSSIDNRSDAWQCKSDKDSRVLDPCFIKTYVKTEVAVCPFSPWQNQSVVIKLTPPLPPRNPHEQDNLDMSEDDPWAIVLTNGTHCLKLSTKTFTVHGQEIKYACDNAGFLLGHIQRCDLIWKMLFLPSRESNHLSTVEMSTAWY